MHDYTESHVGYIQQQVESDISTTPKLLHESFPGEPEAFPSMNHC